MNTGIGIKFLSNREQNIFLLGIMIKISVINSCPMPTDKNHKEILINELKKFLMENPSYSTMTIDEILTAFRFNAAGTFDERIEHYQTLFNLDYLGKVLQQWKKFKTKIQAKADLEQMKINLYEPKLEEINSKYEALEYSRKIWDETNDYLFIRSAAYDHLNKTGKLVLSNEIKKEIKALANEKLNGIMSDYRYRCISELVFINSEFETFLINKISKKIAVSEYFQEKRFSNKPYITSGENWRKLANV